MDTNSLTHGTSALWPEQAGLAQLVAKLGSPHPADRRHSREALVAYGSPAVPLLVAALKHRDRAVRWEAAKALAEIADPSAADALVDALEDSEFGVRWVAAEGVAALGETGLRALLKQLIIRPESIWLRGRAHQALHMLAEQGLADEVSPVLAALDGAEPGIEVSRAAWSVLRGTGRPPLAGSRAER